MRMYFFTNGKRVQNVGLRAKLLLRIHQQKLVGFVENAPTGTSVAVEVWGSKKSLLDFYQIVNKIKPKHSELTQPFFDDVKMPKSQKEIRELMYFNLEQLDKFIGVGITMRNEIKEMGKKLDTGFDRVVTAIQK